MAQHVFDDTTLECPDDFHATWIVSAPVDKEKPEFASNLVFTRDRLRQGESAATYVSRQLVDLARGLRKFRLHGREDVEVAGHPAQRISCGWLGGQGPIEQRLWIVVKNDRALTYTASVPKAKADALFPVFDAIIGSLVLRP